MSKPHSPLTIGSTSNSPSTPGHDNNLTSHPTSTTSTHSGQPTASIASPSPAIAHPLPRKSPKRRPPTSGGPSSDGTFQEAMTPGAPQSRPEPPGHPTTISSVNSCSSPHPAGTPRTEPMAEEFWSSPLHEEGLTQREQIARPHRRVPSRLNLSSISNHGCSSSSPDTTKVRTSPPPPNAEHALPLDSDVPESKSRSRQGSSSTSQPAHQLERSAGAVDSPPPPPPARQRPRRGTGDSEDVPDCQSATTSANLDSPSTKAMMERLLSAPDYFSLHGQHHMDDDDDDSSGSLKFARGFEEEEENEVRPLRSVREQRERLKIRKLLGDDVDDNREDFSRPLPVGRFSSDGDFRQSAAARKQGSAGIDALMFPSGERKQSTPSSFKIREPSSPIAHGLWSSSLPSLDDHGPAEQHLSSQERLLLPRVSQDSRQRSASRDPYLSSPPASPRELQFSPTSNRHPRVHALDALHPQIATVKRSKTTSGAVRASDLHSPQVYPPPRVSSRNALRIQKDTTTQLCVGKEADISARPRVKTSKSAKSLSISKSEPHHSTTPAGVIVEEYKRQILDTQNATSPSAKESKRLSALQWMIEQTKSVTRSKSASASVPASPLSPSHSASPPLSSANFTRSYAPTRTVTRTSSLTTDHHLSPGGIDHGLSLPPLPSPMSAVSANNSSTSLLSPEARFGRPAPMYALGRGTQRTRVDPPLSPVLSSAYAQPPDSPWDGSSSLLVPGSPRSEGHHSSETGHYAPARSHPEYWSSGETKSKEKEKRGLVSGLGKKLSKKRLRKKKGDTDEAAGQDGVSRSRGRGRSGSRDEGAQSDVPVPRVPRRGVSVDRPQVIRHRKSLRLSIDKFADDEDVSSPPSSFYGVRSPVHRSKSSPGESLPPVESAAGTKATKKEGGGKNFWKLVKRIGSSGGLRDKYQSNSYSPMPALPLPSLETVLTPLRAEVDGYQGLSRGRRASVEQLTSATPSNFSTPAKTPASSVGLKHASSSADGHNSYYAHSKAHPQNIKNRSSAPTSSDHSSSSRVFQRAHSSRSSISSSAELGIAPPLPTHPPSAFLAQRFGPRSDYGHQSDESHRPPPGRASSQRTRRSSNKSTKTTTEDDWMTPETAVPVSPPSLPTPPRRPKPSITTSLEDVRLNVEDANDFDSGSPLIPVFTVGNAINQFKRRKPSNAGPDGGLGPPPSGSTSNTPSFNQLEAFPVIRSPSSLSRSSSMPPPPRPARDARRPTPSRTPSGPQQDSSSSVDSSPAPRGKLKKIKRDKHVSDFPPKLPTSALGQSPGLGKSNDSTPSLPDLPSQHMLSGSSSPLVTSPISQSSSNPRSPANDFVSVGFRERGSLQLNRGLSEREKAEKWDALLEKSEQAGGTLHLTLGLAPGNLDSDRLTLNSTISVDDP